MSDYLTAELIGLYANGTKKWIGTLDAAGQEQIGGPSIASVVQISGSRSLTASDDGNVLELTNPTLTLTVPNTGLSSTFSCVVIPNGTTSIASQSTALLNGATTTLSRSFASTPMFAIQARGSASNSYVVSGG